MLTIQAELIHTEQVAPEHHLLRLGCPPVAEQAQPGQFVTVRVANTDAPLLRRPFSIMNVNRAEGSIELLIRVVGRGTQMLAEATPGTYFDLVGPTGQPFLRPDSPEEVLLVAGGVGVARGIGRRGLRRNRAASPSWSRDACGGIAFRMKDPGYV